jgi:hypothetical protein
MIDVFGSDTHSALFVGLMRSVLTFGLLLKRGVTDDRCIPRLFVCRFDLIGHLTSCNP